MPPEPGSPADWVRHARSDLAVAAGSHDAAVLRETLCFHAQQAVEKSLKAVLLAERIAFPRTHNLRTLVDLMPQTLSLPEDVARSVELSGYAVMIRYPGDYEEITDSEYQEALRLAESVAGWAESVIRNRPSAAERGLTIRRMRDEEAARVSEILHACFRWLAQREGFTPRQLDFLLNARSSEETVLEESRTRPHLIALSAGRVVGMVVVNGNEIARLYVDPVCHRQGIGKVLFDAAEDMIRRAGFDEMRVGALVGGAAAFYRSMGMSVAGHVIWEPNVFGEREVTIMTKKV